MKGRAGGHLNSQIHKLGVDVAKSGILSLGDRFSDQKVDRKFFPGTFFGEDCLFYISTKSHGNEIIENEIQKVIGIDHDKFNDLLEYQKENDTKICLLMIDPVLKSGYGGLIDDLKKPKSFMDIEYPLIMNKPKLGGEIIYWNIYKLKSLFKVSEIDAKKIIDLKIRNKADKHQTQLF